MTTRHSGETETLNILNTITMFPQKKDRYYTVEVDGSARVESRIYKGSKIDIRRKKVGNCYRTIRDARAAAKEVNAVFKNNL